MMHHILPDILVESLRQHVIIVASLPFYKEPGLSFNDFRIILPMNGTDEYLLRRSVLIHKKCMALLRNSFIGSIVTQW